MADLMGRADRVARGVLGPAYKPLMSAASLFDPRPIHQGVNQAVRQFQGGQGALSGLTMAGAVLGATPMGRGPKVAVHGLRDIRPPKENLRTVFDSNFEHGRIIGDDTARVADLSGGVRLSDARARKRVDDLADNISGEDGYFERIIVDTKNNVVEGQHRLEAMRKLGVDEIPVVRMEDYGDSLPVDRMTKAVEDIGGIHSDHVNQLVDRAISAIQEAGSAKAALKDYELSGFQKYFEAALKAAD
tara:strand:- start:193 stop:927 length:735 start_codon:yes stop_codon:yes gene_type:complete